MAKKFKWPVLAADRQKLLPKESLSSSKVAELSIGDLKVTVNGDKFWAVWITVLQRILQPTCEAVYGAHLQLPFESLGLDNLELAGRARKRNIAQNHLQVRGRFPCPSPLTWRKEGRRQGRQDSWCSDTDHFSSRSVDVLHCPFQLSRCIDQVLAGRARAGREVARRKQQNAATVASGEASV